MPRAREKNSGVECPTNESLIYIEEAASLLGTTVWGIYNRIRREQIPPSCVIQDQPGARILLDRAKLEALYPRGKRGLRRIEPKKPPNGHGRKASTLATPYELSSFDRAKS